MEGLTANLAERAIVSRPREGEPLSGDAYWIAESRDTLRVAVVDGLGHGPGAATAAERALTLVRAGAAEPITAVLQRCHAGLQSERGVALSLVHIDARAATVEWAGVGNVACILARAAALGGVRLHGLMPVRGVLGRGRPKLTSAVHALVAGDVLVLTTDGVEPRFQHELPVLQPLERAVERILQQFGNPADDALVVALRYRGASA
jgi:serine phosphatase RsbU (regulator of sigma subunit)